MKVCQESADIVIQSIIYLIEILQVCHQSIRLFQGPLELALRFIKLGILDSGALFVALKCTRKRLHFGKSTYYSGLQSYCTKYAHVRADVKILSL
jgi:hypothetical protein